MKQRSLWPEKEKNGESNDWTKDLVPPPVFSIKQTKFRSKEEYYESEEWEKRRAFILLKANHRCQRCGRMGILQVHHLTYDNLYREKPEDLEAVCLKCHPKADREREADAAYTNAFESYMTTKYGEDWDYWDGCEDEFDAWLERQSG